VRRVPRGSSPAARGRSQMPARGGTQRSAGAHGLQGRAGRDEHRLALVVMPIDLRLGGRGRRLQQHHAGVEHERSRSRASGSPSRLTRGSGGHLAIGRAAHRAVARHERQVVPVVPWSIASKQRCCHGRRLLAVKRAGGAPWPRPAPRESLAAQAGVDVGVIACAGCLRSAPVVAPAPAPWRRPTPAAAARRSAAPSAARRRRARRRRPQR